VRGNWAREPQGIDKQGVPVQSLKVKRRVDIRKPEETRSWPRRAFHLFPLNVDSMDGPFVTEDWVSGAWWRLRTYTLVRAPKPSVGQAGSCSRAIS